MNERPRAGILREAVPVAALLAYFLGQTIYYFTHSLFFGQGTTYLTNFLEIGLPGYVRVWGVGALVFLGLAGAIAVIGRRS